MSKYIKSLSRIKTVLLLLLVLVLVASCAKAPASENESDKQLSPPSYTELDLSGYIRLEKYTGLHVLLAEDDDKENALWKALLASAEIIKYPEGSVEYYFSETKEKYMEYAEGDPKKYAITLDYFGITEDDMLKDAREMVKKDLIRFAIVKDAGITLTDEEKNKYFDKYVDFYVESYKYDREYVKENMTELIYDSMLYDKMIEYLIINNDFVSGEAILIRSNII